MRGRDAKGERDPYVGPFPKSHNSQFRVGTEPRTAQGLHWQEVGDSRWDWELNPGTQIWESGTLTARLNTHCSI